MQAAPAARATRSFEEGLSWLALLLAFSPVWVDLLRELQALPFALSLLLPVPLALRCGLLRSSPASALAPESFRGTLLTLSGVALELLGLFAGSWSIARLGLPLAVVGMAFRMGRPAPFVAAFSFWLVPLPTFFYAQTSPVAESLWAELAGGIFRSFGGEITITGPTVTHAAGRLVFEPYASGLHLAMVLAMVGWYSAILRRENLAEALARSLRAAVLGVPCQLFGALVGMVILAQGRSEWAEAWMDHGLWMVVAGVAVARAEWWRRGASVIPANDLDPGSAAAPDSDDGRA